MLRRVSLCAACLATQSIIPGSAFTLPRQVAVRRASVLKSTHLGLTNPGRAHHDDASTARRKRRRHEHAVARIFNEIATSEQTLDDRQSAIEDKTFVFGGRAPAEVCPELAAGDPVSDGTGNNDPDQPAFPFGRYTKKAVTMGIMLACSMLALLTPLLLDAATIPPALALDATTPLQNEQFKQEEQQQQQQQQQQQEQTSSGPTRTKKTHPPPPEIPPGRITIAQWCDRNIGRYLRKLDVQTVSRTIEKIRLNSGPAPTVEGIRDLVGKVARREWGESLVNALRGSTTSQGSDPAGDSATMSSAAGVSTEAPSLEPPKSASQLQIDALKAEMLSLQAAPPEQTPARVTSDNDGPAQSRVTSALPSSFKLGLSVPQVGRRDAETAQAGLEQPATPRKETRRRGQRATSAAVVDLKAELQAQAEKAADKEPPPERLQQRRGRSRSDDATQAAQLKAMEVVPAAPLYSPPPPETSAAAQTSDRQGDSSRGPESDIPRGAMAAFNDVSSTVRASLKGLDGVRKAETRQDVVDQGMAAINRLQAEADRISAGLGGADAPRIEKPSTDMSKVLEAGEAADGRLADPSIDIGTDGSVSANPAGTAAADVRSIAAGVVGAGIAIARSLFEMLRRNAGNVLLPLAESGERKMSDGVAGLAESASNRMAEVQERALSSQAAETLGRASLQAGDTVSRMTGELTRQASGYASVREFSSWAKGPLNQMSTLGVGVADGATAAAQEFSATIRRISGSSTLAGAEDDRVVYAAGAAAIAIAFIVVRGVGEAGAGAEMGAGSVDAVGKDATDEGQLLQPIGVTIQDTVVVPEGERHGAEAISATGVLWDMIRDSRTGAGDSVREVSEEDLLARAAEVGGQLRETAQGLEILKEEVLALRASIRENDMEGQALREKLASALEKHVT